MKPQRRGELLYLPSGPFQGRFTHPCSLSRGDDKEEGWRTRRSMGVTGAPGIEKGEEFHKGVKVTKSGTVPMAPEHTTDNSGMFAGQHIKESTRTL